MTRRDGTVSAHSLPPAGSDIVSQEPGQTGHLAAISAYVDEHAESMLEQLKTLVRQLSISTQDAGVKECAELPAGMMRDDGLETEILPTAGQPIIVGKGEHVPGAPTALIRVGSLAVGSVRKPVTSRPSAACAPRSRRG
jgi:hypothetical protein